MPYSSVSGVCWAKPYSSFAQSGFCAALIKVEKPGVEDVVRIDNRMIGFDQVGIGVEGLDDLAGGVRSFRPGIADLVQDHHVGEFDLVGQEVDEGAFVPVAKAFATVGERIVAGEVTQRG
jgi:hypothetical protein